MSPDTGEPIRILLEQESQPSSGFIAKIRRKVYRRTATSQLAGFSWHLPKVIFVEMLGVFAHLFSAFGTDKDSR
jgi:hypothetical protein